MGEENRLDYQIDIAEQNMGIAIGIIAIAFLCAVLMVVIELPKGYGYPVGMILVCFYIIRDARREKKKLEQMKKALNGGNRDGNMAI